MYRVKALDVHKGEITDTVLEQIINERAITQELVAMAIGSQQLILVFKDIESSEIQ